MNYFLDTNAIIYFLQGYKELEQIFQDIRFGRVFPYVSVVTRIELLSFPDMTSAEERSLEQLLGNFNVVMLNDDIIDETIKIRKRVRLKIPDAVIAASVTLYEGTLVTRNTREFKKVKGLKILNPFE